MAEEMNFRCEWVADRLDMLDNGIDVKRLLGAT
jgi:hypothetical protein